MFNDFCRKKIIRKMATQGQHYLENEKFFKEHWEAMRQEFSEENNTTTASFILERWLSVLPLDTITKNALIKDIEAAYKELIP